MTPLPNRAHAPGLRISYERQALAPILARSNTLAVIGFGAEGFADADARAIAVPLTPLANDATVLESWRVDGPVDHGRDGELAWAKGGGYLMLSVRVAEAAHGGPQGAARHAYSLLMRALRQHQHPHLLRAWNYLADINRGEGDDERYRHFTIGRADGIASLHDQGFPAATAIGRLDGVAELVVYALAGLQPGTSIENPRQVSAYRYPRQYGPVPPSFARAMRVDSQPLSLLVSGTASVVGHVSMHDDAEAQAQETLRNLDSLIAAAGLGQGLADVDARLKAYLRHSVDAPLLLATLARAGVTRDQVLCLHGDICRRELLLEIDGCLVGQP